MKCLAIVSESTIQIVEKETPQLTEGRALVKVRATALNKRDQFIRQGKYPSIQFGATLGSDGVGQVVDVNDSSSQHWIGKEVIINPNINWGENEEVQSSDYNILGMPTDGTFAEYVSVNIDRLYTIPSHLNSIEAAGLPLAGLTAFRACFHQGNITAKSTVLISGFGGGVAQFAFQFAVATGAKVFVTSSSSQKIEKAKELGAVAGFNYKEPEWAKEASKISGGFDVVIDSAGGDQINTLLRLMRPGGRVVFYGATNGLPKSVDLYRMFWNQLSLQGSTMGNDAEFKAMLAFVEKHKVNPLIDSVRPFDQIVSAFDDIASSNKLGKLIIEFRL